MTEKEIKFVKFEKVPLHSLGKSEQWLEDYIVKNTGILGLGDLSLVERQRAQPTGGRLDLLLQDDDDTRYAVELQLGTVNPSHIIRTIEYWDTECKRYPQYDHVAVIVAEDITSRFFNVISLFNGMIPLIAIQVSAFTFKSKAGLNFVQVLDQMPLGSIDDDVGMEVTDRAYWEKRASKQTVRMADELLDIAKQRCKKPSLKLKYNKHYIGLALAGQTRNFFRARPKKEFMRVSFRLPRSGTTIKQLDDAGVDAVYKQHSYVLRLWPGDIKKHADILKDLIQHPYEQIDDDT